MTIVPQPCSLFVTYLGADGAGCRVFPGVHMVTGWKYITEEGMPEPITVPLGAAQDPGDDAFTRHFWHSHEAAAAAVAYEQSIPAHGAGHLS